MSALRDRILAIVSKACFNSDDPCDPCDVCGQRADAVIAEFQPALDAKDTEIARLTASVERVRKVIEREKSSSSAYGSAMTGATLVDEFDLDEVLASLAQPGDQEARGEG